MRENGDRDSAEGVEGTEGFPEVSTKLDLESMFTIAIDENKARLTIARATLETSVSFSSRSLLPTKLTSCMRQSSANDRRSRSDGSSLFGRHGVAIAGGVHGS